MLFLTMSSETDKTGLILSKLPTELLIIIVSYLNRKDKGNVRLTCKQFKGIVDMPSVWSKLRVQLKLSPTARMTNYFCATLQRRNLRNLSLLAPGEWRKDTIDRLVKACPNLSSLACMRKDFLYVHKCLLEEGTIGNIKHLTCHDPHPKKTDYLTELKSFLNLVEFELTICILKEVDMKHLKVLTKLQKLEKLSLTQTLICDFQLEIKLRLPLYNFKQLKHVSVVGIPVSETWFTPPSKSSTNSTLSLTKLCAELDGDIGSCLKLVPKVTSLEVTIRSSVDDYLTAIKRHLPHLVSLGLNFIQDAGRYCRPNFLSDIPQNVTSLTVTNKGQHYPSICVLHLDPCLLSNLEELSLVKFFLEPRDVQHIAKHCRSLRKLGFLLRVNNPLDMVHVMPLYELPLLRHVIFSSSDINEVKKYSELLYTLSDHRIAVNPHLES